MYTGILGAATTTTAAIVLPNTGGNHLLTITALVSMGVGVVAITTSVVRMVAKKVYQA